MPNRFTAPEKWIDPWFCGLNEQDKLFWIYLCDNCNHAGIWNVNWPLVKFHIKNYEFDKTRFNGRIEILDEECWFIKKFVLFQQKVDSLEDLNPFNKCHLSIINILTNKGLLSPKQAPKKGLRRGLGIGIGIGNSNKGIVKGGFNFESVYSKYPNKVGRKAAEVHFMASVKTQEDFDDINKALDNYIKSERVAKGFVQNADTWFNNWKDWIVMPTSNDTIPESMRKFIKKE